LSEAARLAQPVDYLPQPARIEEVTPETPDTKTFRLRFLDDSAGAAFVHKPGQFLVLSLFGEGEAPFCVSSAPSQRDFLEISVKRMGKVTSALHELSAGAPVGIRGPYGNDFRLEDAKGKRLLVVGGGIGLAPLRPLIYTALEHRADYEDLWIIYGARSPADLVYRRELDEWAKRDDCRLDLTVDRGDENWKGHVGFVPQFLAELAPPVANTIAYTCGPPIMIKFVIQNLMQLGFSPEQIVTTLEMKMKCGVGKCGRCNIGPTYVCLDGPVFTYAQLQSLPAEY
jgi:NAD(P)H-flavin reductase